MGIGNNVTFLFSVPVPESFQLQNNQIYNQDAYQYANPSKRLEKIKGDVLSCVKSLTVVKRKETNISDIKPPGLYGNKNTTIRSK